MRHPRIRRARETDLAALTGELGQGPYFADRISRQSHGRGVLLTAWQDGLPVGDVYLWLEPAEEPEIREHLPDTPLVTHLEVHPDHRNLGFGTILLAAAETELAGLGYRRVALGVQETNHEATELYLRNGYHEWPHDTILCYTPEDGDGHREPEVCRIMVKELSEPQVRGLPGQPQP